MREVEVGVLCHLNVQLSGFDSEFKNEKLTCDAFS